MVANQYTDPGKATSPHKTLEERLVEFYGKPIEEIERIQNQEEDWGEVKGAEIILHENGGDSNG